jgi:hypothetical protein
LARRTISGCRYLIQKLAVGRVMLMGSLFPF